MSYTGQNPRFNSTILTDIGIGGSTNNPPSGAHKIVNRAGSLKLRDSSGLESSLGGGSGELNLIENPSDAGSWSKTGTVFANPVTTTTAGDLPLGGIIDTAIQFVATNSGSEASEYNSYSFTTPAGLFGKQKINFHMRPGSGFAESQWTVSIYQSSTRQNLSTDSSGVTYLVNRTGSFTTTVDLLANTAYTLRFARISGTGSATLNIANVIVGPGIQPQGAVIGGPISYTPTYSSSNISTQFAFYRQVGNNMELNVRFSFTAGGTGGTFTFSLPSGLSIDTSFNTGGAASKYGWGSLFSTNAFSLAIGQNSSTTFVLSKTANNTSGLLSGTDFISGDVVNIVMSVPIAEWAGSGTVNLAQNDVEYAFNSSATTSSDTTSFGYGPDGFAIQAFAPAGTANVQKRIQWQRPAQVGDVFTVEVYDGTNWIGMEDRLAGRSLNDAGTTAYGYSLTSVSSTQMDVNFFSAPFPGLAWSSITSFKWRVRKSSAGAAVGFGKATSVSTGLVAPRRGQYSLTVTGTNWTTVRAVGIYYQDQDGIPRLKFNIIGTLSSTTTAFTGTITGVTFKSGTNLFQAIAAHAQQDGVGIRQIVGSYVSPSSGDFYVGASSAANRICISGDVELESVPTWA